MFTAALYMWYLLTRERTLTKQR